MGKTLHCLGRHINQVLLRLAGNRIVAYCTMVSDTCTEKVAPPKSKKKRKEKRKQRKEAENENREKKKRPNYFLGIRFFNPEIVGKVLAIQERVKLLQPALGNACIPIATTHVTLAVMHLEDDIAIEKASAILQECKDEISCILEDTNFELEVKGLGDFRHEVLFAKLVEGDSLNKLTQIAELLQNKLEEFVDKKDTFKPHLTILKLSKLKYKHKKIRKIDSSLYKPFVGLYFGKQAVNSIELLSMTKKKQVDGYYHSESEINFGLKEDSKETSCLDRWAECIAVCCITTALLSGKVTVIDEFADRLVTTTINSCLSKPTGEMEQKLQKFRETVRSKPVVDRIKQELDSAK